MTDTRTPTAVDRVAEQYLDAAAALDPMLATYIGLTGHDDALPSYDPDWYAERSALRAATLDQLHAATATDPTDKITIAALGGDLEVAERLRALGEEESHLNNIDSPLQGIRDIFDLTPTASVDDWTAAATRLGAVSAAVDGYIASLRYAADRGYVSARRQVEIAIKQCADNVGPDGFFGDWACTAATSTGAALPDSLRADLARNAESASEAYARLETFLGEELLGRAGEVDAVGRERYIPNSQRFLGATVDLEETYEWGQEELARIVAEMHRTADKIAPGESVVEAIEALDGDAARLLHGTDALQAWMQEKSDAAIEALAGSHFDIPEPIRTLECRIAPTSAGGIYYTGPSDDLVTRPGRMWWSVPKGVTSFATWKELTTVYHEGVPGHHLQIAQTVYRRDLLNRWRRLACWSSGYGEGWALYAEQLMADLGFLDDPADYLGMLDGQSLRAARVVLDIGIHCGFPAPASVGGGAWDYDKAWQFLSEHCHSAEGFRRFELDRYLGWPGQAPAYKVGQRLWFRLRDQVREREGDGFDLAAFHRRALDIGAVGLDVLRSALLGDFD
ncbi:MAG TPA: DUF885 domain-containing protein [Jatrophihabitans sp.]|jgi:uncharacterized protein (DUF885 family)